MEEDEETGDGGRGLRGGDALHCAAAQPQVRQGQRPQQEVLRLQVLHLPQPPVPELDEGAGHKVGEQPGERVWR